jgi:hypothetical protein
MRASIVGRAVACCLSLAACADVPTAPKPMDRASIYDAIWHDVDLNYPGFIWNGVNWDSVGQVHRPRAIEAPTDRGFVAEIGALLSELRDPHVSITAPGIGLPIRYVASFDTAPTHFNARETVARYLHAPDTAASGSLVFGRLTPEVGYIRLASFSATGWAGDVEHALKKLRSSGLIVDLRDNMGGDRATALSIASLFADRSRTFGYLRYRNGTSHDALTAFERERIAPIGVRRFAGPVYLLTNRRVLSSAEEFVLAMRTLPNVTVVGDTSGGASGGPVMRSLPNGWTYQYSRWVEYTAAGRIFQETGIAPDLVVAPGDARGDATLEKARDLCLSALAAHARH